MRTWRVAVGVAVLAAVAATVPTGQATAGPGWAVVVVDQASRRVLVLQSAEELMAYRGPDRLPVVWSWSADTAPDLDDLRPERSWSMPDEAKSRVRHGRRYLLTTASGGLAAAVDTATGAAAWAVDTGPLANPHSAELLPDGNVAVAASTGGWIRLYTASQGPRSSVHAEFRLPGAHGVHWDRRTGLLWAVGDDTLTALRVGGTAAAPTLTAVRAVPLPEPGGHDLAPVLATPGRFWVSTAGHLWRFDPATDRFSKVGLGGEQAGRDVKSVGDEPGSGRLLIAAPDHAGPCSWCTSVLSLHRPDAVRRLPGAWLYKARWWTSWGSAA
ncbi:DUF6528 family protein [Streptomyces sp. BE20]|uniref:DUF6528 family protein n=1 Tax=Streptomycetaceae TaxID=2062 RepID=UPI002E783564|nr:DUF6528 family protein [Streptomyces sp. BE20]MEE1824820.1 DUF6528 family protein [Streptomyces sp. BE20]